MEYKVEYKDNYGNWARSAFITEDYTVEETYSRVQECQDAGMEYRIVIPVPRKEEPKVVVEILLPLSDWATSSDFSGPYTTIAEALEVMGDQNAELKYRLVQGDKVYSLKPPVMNGWALAD